MATDFAKLVTLEVKKAKSSSTQTLDSTNSKKETTKEKPSLFDSLLSKAKKEVESTKDVKTTSKTKTTPKQQNNDSTKIKVEKTSIQNGLVLDKIKFDAKNQTKIEAIKNKSDTVKDNIIKQETHVDIDNKGVNKKQIINQKPVEIKKTTKKQNIESIKPISIENKKVKILGLKENKENQIKEVAKPILVQKNKQQVEIENTENKKQLNIKEDIVSNVEIKDKKQVDIKKVIEPKTKEQVSNKQLEDNKQQIEIKDTKKQKQEIVKEFIKTKIVIEEKKSIHSNDTKKIVEPKVQRKVLKKQVEIKDTKKTVEPKVDKQVSKKQVEIKDIKKAVEPKVDEKISNDANLELIKEESVIKYAEQPSDSKDIKIDIQGQIVEKIDEVKVPTKKLSMLDRMLVGLSDKTEQINTKIDKEVDIKANLFLGTQKSTKKIDSQYKILESKQVLAETKDITAVQKSAKILNLEATNIELEHTEEQNKQQDVSIPTIKVNSNVLNKLGIAQEHHTNTIHQIQKMQKDSESKIIEENDVKKKQIKETIELNVSNSIAQSMHSKIIGARQQLGSFMSEVARNMAQNYRPPITAFRMILNPANLGTIAIVMKSNKSDGGSMNITMNMSNVSTLDAFNDNKLSLQNSLQKSLTQTASNISLSFGMQSDSSNQSFNQQQQEQNNNQYNQSIHIGNEKNEEIILDDTQSYM